MPRPIFTGLAPNCELDDALLSLRLLLSLQSRGRGEAVQKLEHKFCRWLPTKHALAFSSGRSALYVILKALNLDASAEVLLQAYTCVAVPDPILWAGARPVYVDCENDSLNMDPDDLARKITPQSRVLILQHTFGLPANLDALLKIARQHGLFTIEDCAHALGARYHGGHVGTFADAAFFSFGRDKVISSVFGGMAVTPDSQFSEKLRRERDKFAIAPRIWVFQQLLHPIITIKAKWFYRVFGIGKIILALSKKTRLLSKSVCAGEKEGSMPRFVRFKMPNALALLALHQFEKLERFNAHRQKIAALYDTRLSPSPNLRLPSPLGRGERGGTQRIYLRYTIQTPYAARILTAAKKLHIFLGDWYRTPIAPAGVDYNAVGYKMGTCPIAEQLARESINLPTDIHISPKTAARIAGILTADDSS